MKKTILMLSIGVAALSITACKTDKKPEATAETTTPSVAKGISEADSLAALAAAEADKSREDSIARANAEAEAAEREKQAQTSTKQPAAKPAPKPAPKPSTGTGATAPIPKPAKTPAKSTVDKSITRTDNPTDNVVKRAGRDDVFVISEVAPSYPGGEKAMMKYLRSNIKYPKKAKEEGVKGTVFVKFVVEKDGLVDDVVVSKGVHPLLDAEAKRVVNAMPKWVAGKQNSRAVAVQYTLPVKFDLIE
jgi:periplasmic protein TonB